MFAKARLHLLSHTTTSAQRTLKAFTKPNSHFNGTIEYRKITEHCINPMEQKEFPNLFVRTFNTGYSFIVLNKLYGMCLVLGSSPCSLWPSIRTLLK